MSSPTEILTDDAKLLGWLHSHGVPIVTSFGIDRYAGRTGPVRFTCTDIDLAQLKAGLAELLAQHHEHIDADHAALRRVWELHTSGQDYCPEDGFSEPCRTKRAISGEDEEPPHKGILIEVPPQPWTATCPQCGMTRSLPDDWERLLRDSLPKEDNVAWDGQMRCQNDHDPVVMEVTANA